MQPDGDRNPSRGSQIWANVPQIASILALIAVLYGAVAWGIGSVRPQTQIDIDNLKAELVKTQARLSVAETKLDGLPRQSDFADWTAHLSRLDAVYEAQRDKVTEAGYNIKDLQNKYQALTTTPAHK